MPLHPLDLAIVAGWLLFTLLAGVWFSRRASTSTASYFVSDRSLPWWAVGTSMVATTFAADTPLVVSGWVASKGIAENWVWWTMGLSGPVSVFLFARLWRRTGAVTDAELTELRYPGKAGVVLRGLKAFWFGAFMNLLVIAWVMRAMTKIVLVVSGLPAGTLWLGVPAEVWIVLGLFVLTVFYTVSSGLWGVIATDILQFGVAMGASVVLGVLAWNRVGGREGLRRAFATHGFDWEKTTTLLPLSDSAPDGATAAFLVMMTVIWWSAKNADGGGYLAQRLFAAKDDRHALWAYLWFTVAHICLRPWPWIAVGLAGMALYGPVTDAETYYPRVMVDLLPPGLFGLMLAAFLAAFMSTIDTQLHWGSSLLVNDLYTRFVAPDAPEARQVMVSRLCVLGLAVLGGIVSFAIDDIGAAWKLSLSVTAGIGTVYMARWYWWRVNAWSEIVAMLAAGVLTGAFLWAEGAHPANGGAWTSLAAVPKGWLVFPFNAAAIALIAMPLWIGASFVGPVDREHLRAFYLKVRPGGPGWRAIAGDLPGFADDGPGWGTVFGIVGCVGAVMGSLLGIGELLVGSPWLGAAELGAAALGAALAGRQVARETGLVAAAARA